MNYHQFLQEAGKHLRSTPAQVEKLIKTAPFRYRHYTVAKRSGGRRDIFHPSPALKSIQRWLIGSPLSAIPVHDDVYSYVDGKNIGMNAARHAASNYFIRFDFENFFASIRGGVLRGFLRGQVARGTINFDEATISATVRLVCRIFKDDSLALTIGAPSSPFLSNAVLYDFDSAVSEIAAANGIVYTRYADDVYVSGQSMAAVNSFEDEFRRLVFDKIPFVRINEDKVQHLSRKRRVSVTGINITPRRELSVGRLRKRRIRTMLYLASKGELASDSYLSLRGDIAFVNSVEPLFVDRLRLKFGDDFITSFLRGDFATS